MNILTFPTHLKVQAACSYVASRLYLHLASLPSPRFITVKSVLYRSWVQYILQWPIATFGAGTAAVYMEVLHSHIAAVVHSCGIWHIALDSANGRQAEVYLPRTVNLHLTFLYGGSHILVMLYKFKKRAFQKYKCWGSIATPSKDP